MKEAADNIGPMDTVIDGQKAQIIYIDENWNPVPKYRATMAVIIYADGGEDVIVLD